MSNSKVQNLLAQTTDFSYEDFIALNRAIVTLCKQRSRVNAVAASSKFVPGQVVRFTKSGRGKYAGTHYIRVSGYNRAGTHLVGKECNAQGIELPFAVKWTVVASVATLHDVSN